MVTQRQADGDGQSTGHDGVAPVERRRETSNRCMDPPRPWLHPALLPNISAMTDFHRHASREGVAVLAVGGHDSVAGRQGADHADGDGLLADAQMQETPDLRRAVELSALLLEAPDAHHLAQQPGEQLEEQLP